MKIRFSIIVTVFNKEMWIKRCIKSILTQTYTDYELLIINDGSTDDSGKICENFEGESEKIRYFYQDNKGLTATRKKGIKESKGEYIIFVDADDYISEIYLENYNRYIEKYTPDIIVDSLLKEYPQGKEIKIKNRIDDGYYEGELLEKNVLLDMIYTGNFYEKGLESYICAKAISYELLKEVSNTIDDRIGFAEGGVWLYSVLLKARNAYLCSDYSYHYCMYENSMAISDVDDRGLYYVWKNLKNNIRRHGKNTDELELKLKYLISFFMIWKKLDYINEGRDSFYPYERLEKHSRVVIMGAWRYGRKLIEYIRRTNYFEIVLVVDNNYDAYNELDFDIQPVSKILDIKYDYIILGSLVYSTVESMKQDLRGLGITNNIVSVTSEDIAFDRIPFLCSEDKK